MLQNHHIKKRLLGIYNKLYKYFGPQNWWPGETALEVIVGAVLAQNTAWANVEKAIFNLKEARCLSFDRLSHLKEKDLASLIKPAGYYNIKAKRLKNLLEFLVESCNGNLGRLSLRDTAQLRIELLSVNGVGPETADSILLYALDKPVFVVDAYTKRIISRHNFLEETTDYHTVARFFMDNLPNDAQFFNEYHALIVRCAKDFCKKSKQNCEQCPVNEKK